MYRLSCCKYTVFCLRQARLFTYRHLVRNRCYSISNSNNLPGPSSTPTIKRECRSQIFTESCDRVKRRKIVTLRQTHSYEEIKHAAILKLREEGEESTAKLLKKCVASTSSNTSTDILRKWKAKDITQTELSAEKALCLIISLNLNKEAYNTLRSTVNYHGHRLYPPYSIIIQTKKQFYPEGIIISEKKM